MSKQFKAGDKVKCVKPDSNNLLTLNKVYTILSTRQSGRCDTCYVNFETDVIDIYWWCSDRFELIDLFTLPEELFAL